jgi:hypothetical protein
VFVAPADLLSQHPDVGHQRQIRDVLMDGRAATGRRGFLGNRFDALGLAAHERNFGPSPGELYRSSSPDAASGPRERDYGHGV